MPRLILASVRHSKEVKNDREFILKTLAKLWVSGVNVNWNGVYEQRTTENGQPFFRRVPLPTYPFEKKKYFVKPSQPDFRNLKDFGNLQMPEQPSQPGLVKLETPSSPPANIEQPMTNNTTTRLPTLIAEIRASLHELSGMEPEQMDVEASFLELGFDSLFLSQAVIRFNQKFGQDLSFRMMFEETPTIGALAEYLDEVVDAALFQPELPKVAAVVSNVLASQNGNGVYQNGTEVTATPRNAGEVLNLPGIGRQVVAPSDAVQSIIQQQLALMQQQLAMLGLPLPIAIGISQGGSDGTANVTSPLFLGERSGVRLVPSEESGGGAKSKSAVTPKA